jgi:hypothetical protein
VALGYVASRTVESILILVSVVSLMSAWPCARISPTPQTTAGRLRLPVDCSSCMTKPTFSGRNLRRARQRDPSELLDVAIQTAATTDGDDRPHRWSVGPSRGYRRLVGAWDTTSGLPVALTAPEAIWEFSLSVWLLAKGFRPSPILTCPAGSPGPGAISRVSRRVLLAKSRSAAPVGRCCRPYVDWLSGNVAGIRSVSF